MSECEGAEASLPRLAAVQALRAAAVAVSTDAVDASHSGADSVDVEVLLHELVAASNELARSAQALAEQLERAGVDLPPGWAAGDLSELLGLGATGPELYPASAYRLSAVTGARGLVQYWRETLGRWDGRMRADAMVSLSELARTVVEVSVETERMAALVGEGGSPASKEVRGSLRRASGRLARLARRSRLALAQVVFPAPLAPMTTTRAGRITDGRGSPIGSSRWFRSAGAR